MEFFESILHFVLSAAPRVIGTHTSDGTVYAVDLTDPVGFTTYLGMAFVLYAIRETQIIPIRFMPLIAIVLGISYSTFVEYHAFHQGSVIAGLRLALLGIGSVATIKYFLAKEKVNE